MKVLLGGIPLGCDNIGDEAILACVISVFRGFDEELELSVCTGDIAGVEKKFGVRGVPLYGFDTGLPLDGFRQALAGKDVFVWAGATGLSDYPATGCALLETARACNVKTIVWNVGMNDSFNPAFFKLSGKKLALCKLADTLLHLKLQERVEEYLKRKIRMRIDRALSGCELVILRDSDSLAELKKCGPFPDAVAGADTAILQKAAADDELRWSSEADKEKFFAADKRIALCVSSQSPVKNPDALARFLDDVIREAGEGMLLVMIPMNPLTDHALMGKLQERMACRDHTLLTSFKEPEEVQNIVSACHLVVSSRLHLMILALNALVPCIGIARGSKISSFLNEFGLPTCGSTDSVNFDELKLAIHQLMNDGTFAARAAIVREGMLKRLEAARCKLYAGLKEINCR